jgi:hypothetical protein
MKIYSRLAIVGICWLVLTVWWSLSVLAANATTSVHIVKYDATGSITDETTRSYEWLRDNLPVQGDGETHYYHQGPIFEGDMWDPGESENLKDKGAVQGTALKDLCELVGGMSPQDEIMLKSVDGWHTQFAYENIYQPRPEQGVIALCWYNGEDAVSGERYGVGYPGGGAYHSAMQIIFMAGTTNPDGEYVFGNSDMRVCLPDEKYQHFYEGLPSTNGLSGKWIGEVVIYTGEIPAEALKKMSSVPDSDDTGEFPVVPVVIGGAGLVIIGGSLVFLFRRKSSNKES